MNKRGNEWAKGRDDRRAAVRRGGEFKLDPQRDRKKGNILQGMCLAC